MAAATAESGNSGKRIELRNQLLDVAVNVKHRVRIHYKLLHIGILALAAPAAASEIRKYSFPDCSNRPFGIDLQNVSACCEETYSGSSIQSSVTVRS